MRTINNKYLIEYELNIEENFINYVVSNLDRSEKYLLCVLKNDSTYEKTREYLLSKFRTIKNLNFENVVKIIRVEIIHSMNGIKLDRPQYGYLMENVQAKLDTQLYLKNCNPYKKLDIFMDICAVINTLNMKGYIFDDITLKDIKLIPSSDNNIKVKMKNLLQNELKKFNLINYFPYKYNINKNNEKGRNKNNIGQIIKLFDLIFSEEDLEIELRELKYIKVLNNQINSINASINISYIISYINKKMGTSYKLFVKEELAKLQTNLDLIGMEEEIKIVEKNLQKVLECKENYKIIAFHGDDGSGKSSFLREIKYRIENKYFKDVIYIENARNTEKSRYELYNVYLDYILKKVDANLREKYEIYIRKFISMLFEKEIIEDENEQKLQLINRLGKFMCEYTMTTPFIILIDDLEQMSDIFKLLIRYISLLGSSLQNVFVLFSMNESKSDKKFLSYIKELKDTAQYEEYKINYFNQYDTTKMVRSMLNTNQEVDKLEVKVYAETLGNPQYINSVIKELYDNRNLYFDEIVGEWKINIKVEDILIPKYLEKRLEESISVLNEKEINLLKKLSIFEIPLAEKIIIENIIVKKDERNIYRYLKTKGFFIDKISDQGILVGFSNSLLRNILYLKLNEEQKTEMHSRASNVLEEILYETDYYTEEFLMHLEKSNNYEKAFFYTSKYAKSQEVSGNLFKAISYYEKILRYPKCPNFSEVAISIARIYEKISEHVQSYEYFEKANEYAVINDEIEIKILTLIQMIIIRINNITDVDEGIDYSLSCIRRLLDEKYYPKGEAYYYYALAVRFKIDCEDKFIKSYSEKAIRIFEENGIRDDVYGWAMLTLTDVILREGDHKKARELCLEANEIFVYNYNINGQLFTKLVYANISKEEGSANDKILEQYLEIAKLSNKFKSYKKEILSLIYISDIYSEEKKYEKTEEYLLSALRREREEAMYSYSFTICNKLCLLYVKWGKISLAVKYCYIMKQMQKNLKLLGKDNINANYSYALYNLMICNYEASYNYMKETYALIFSFKNFHYKVMLCEYYEIMLYKCKDEKSIKFIYNKLDEKIKKMQNLQLENEVRIRVIKRILSLGYKEFAKKLFFEIEGYPKDYNVEGMYIYLEFNFKNRSSYNFLISRALRVCTFINNQEIKAELYSIIGEKYSELKCNLLAINYFYESIVVYMEAINCLPKVDKLSYVNNSDFLKTRDLFIKSLNKEVDISVKFKEFNVVKRNRDVNEILNELSVVNLLYKEPVLKLAENLYERFYYNEFSDIFKVFEKFSSDTINNMENLLKYMARLTLSDKAMIILENSESKKEVICTYRISEKDEINKYLSMNIDSDDDIFMSSNYDTRIYQLENEVLKNRIKAFVYMRIINSEKSLEIGSEINAKLILIANNALNNINYESVKVIQKFRPFLVFLLEKYNLTISSTLDKLTGAYNRKYFEEALLFLLDNSRSEKSQFAVIMFDIDDFKGINDKYGHQTGDEVLVKLVKEVKSCISKKDIVGRYGGEEFIILVPNTNKDKVISVAERIRENVESAKLLGDKRKVTISIGITIVTDEIINSKELIERADQALYKAKHEGKNRYIFWERNCGISNNVNNDLIGVFSGNAAKDYNLTLTFKEIANIIKIKDSKEEKIYKFISKVMERIECETATVFCINNGEIINKYSKSKVTENTDIIEKFNYNLIRKVISEKNGQYMVDWSYMDNENEYGIPDWRSLCIVPIICNEEILAIIYLSVSVNKKEFICNDYNLLSFLAEISVPIFLN